jgi:arylsulfatase
MGAPVPEAVAPNLHNRSHVVRAELDVPSGAVASGVLVAQGSVLGGWTLYLLDGYPRYEHNLVGKERHRVVSTTPVPPGLHTVGFEFERTADFAGIGRLYLDDELIGEGEIPRYTPARFSITGAGLTCAYDAGPAVSDDYRAPFTCNVGLRRVTIDVSGTAYRDVEAEFAAIMAEQ